MNGAAMSNETPFTDFELTVDGAPTDGQWEDLMARVEDWAKQHDLDLLGFASHRSNDEGETFRTVRDERDRWKARWKATVEDAESVRAERDALLQEREDYWADIQSEHYRVAKERDALAAEVERLRVEADKKGRRAAYAVSQQVRVIETLIEAIGLDPDSDECLDGCDGAGTEHLLWHLIEQRDALRDRIALVHAITEEERMVRMDPSAPISCEIVDYALSPDVYVGTDPEAVAWVEKHKKSLRDGGAV